MRDPKTGPKRAAGMALATQLHYIRAGPPVSLASGFVRFIVHIICPSCCGLPCGEVVRGAAVVHRLPAGRVEASQWPAGLGFRCCSLGGVAGDIGRPWKRARVRRILVDRGLAVVSGCRGSGGRPRSARRGGRLCALQADMSSTWSGRTKKALPSSWRSVGQVGVCDEAVGGFDVGSPPTPVPDEAVLEGGALGAAAPGE